MRIQYVYVAGPYTNPEPVENCHNAVLVADAVRAAGFTPYLPHTTMLWQLVRPHEPDYWYQLDLEWLAKCDALIRIPGDSTGSDNEVAFAVEHGIPVFYSMDQLIRATRVVQEIDDLPTDPDQ